MNFAVLLFFVHNVLATALLGYKFFSQKDKIFTNLGIALFLDSIAFAVWSAAVYLKPANLQAFVILGAVFFIVSLIFLLITSIQHVSTSTRNMIVLLGTFAGAGVLYLRTFVYPSEAAFSPDGLFFFNLHPIVQMLYIFGLAFTALPAIYVVAAKFKEPYSMLIRYALIAEVMGGIVLITSFDSTVLYIIGWIMGLSYVALWTTLLFNKKAWS